VSTIDTSPSDNGRGSDAWLRSWTYFGINRRSPGYCRVTFDHPPINTITATTVLELAELVGLIEQDPDLNVVVFASANPDFYVAQYDTERTTRAGRRPPGGSVRTARVAGPARAPVPRLGGQHRVDTRSRGAGSEFVLACDLRVASQVPGKRGGRSFRGV